MSDIKTEAFYLEDEDRLVLKNTQDVEEILADNQSAANHTDGYTPSRNMRRVASLPVTIYWDLHQKGILNDPKAFKKFLNDLDNRHFRTSPGRV